MLFFKEQSLAKHTYLSMFLAIDIRSCMSLLSYRCIYLSIPVRALISLPLAMRFRLVPQKLQLSLS